MNQPQQKQYFVQTDGTFQSILDWIADQRANHHLTITGYRQIQLPYISGNNTQYDRYWTRLYDFARTAHVTMRYLMLKATGLIALFDPDTAEPARGRNRNMVNITPPPPNYNRDINYGNHLAATPIDVQWISAHFDMLFPHFHIENRLNGLVVGQTRAFNDQFVVVDTHCKVVWYMVITLTVERQLPLAIDHQEFNLLAIPFLAVYRMEYQYPYQAQPFLWQPPSNEEEIKKMCENFSGYLKLI